MSQQPNRNVEELRALSRKLLEDGAVSVVIGYEAGPVGHATKPVFVTSPDEVGRLVWNEYCAGNLAVYLTRPDVRSLGRPAIVAKGCDVRSILVLLQEAQLERENLVILGMACEQTKDPGRQGNGSAVLAKCLSCQVRTPAVYDHLIGGKIAPATQTPDLSELERLEASSPDQRWEFWRREIEKCTKCYACRAACPLCYCNRCFVDKTRPAWTSTASNWKENFVYHLFRAFHLTGRCVECGACERACPQGVRLGLLNQKMVKEVKELYGHVSGMDAETSAPLCRFQMEDAEDFIA